MQSVAQGHGVPWRGHAPCKMEEVGRELSGPESAPSQWAELGKGPRSQAPALSLDLHSNCHQSTELKTRAEPAACGREGPLPPISLLLLGKGLWAGLLSQEEETESESVCSRKSLGPIQK